MRHLDNPAGRLHNLLAQLSEAARPQGVRMNAILATALNVEKDDSAELLRRTAAVLGLPSEIRDEVTQLRFDGSELVQELKTVEGALQTITHPGPAVNWVKRVTSAAMCELRICSSILHQLRPQGTAPQDKLSDLRVDIATLATEVKDSDIPDELRRDLLSHLGEMQQAVDIYHVVGTRDLRRALDRTAGSLTSQPAWQQLWGTSLGQRLVTVLILVSALVGMAADTAYILEARQSERPAIESPAEDVVPGEVVPPADDGMTVDA